jgi:hypothetical protein
MYVAQDTTDIDGIEHKPLKMTGESDKVEVRKKIIYIDQPIYSFKRAKQYILDSLSKSGGLPLPSRFGANPTSSTSFNDYGSRVNISKVLWCFFLKKIFSRLVAHQ